VTEPAPIPAGRLSPGDFLAAIDSRDLVYFLVNVGDGDAQLVLLPAEADGTRRVLVVDVATIAKLPALLDTLADAGVLPQHPKLFAVVIATHPHDDHIGGLGRFVERFHALIDEFWEPGYYMPSSAYLQLMRALEDHQVRLTQPTSGMTRFVGQVRLTVLSPSIALRNRFDSYGVDINDASLALKIEFPASRVEQRGPDRVYLRQAPRQALILGADAQTQSWAQVMGDFPNLRRDNSPAAEAIGKARGLEPLRAAVFKVPHHGSKHGVNLELVELISPRLSLVSSVARGGKYNFPHAVSQEAIREALEPTAESGRAHRPDHELGLLYTADRDAAGGALGTIAVVMSPTGRKREVWRFTDRPQDLVRIDRAVRQAV
jgi:beta-lactamase superfamily II metal-dependent hydrolase